MATETDQGETPMEQRVERLERGQTTIMEKLDQVLGGKPVTHERAEQDMDTHLGRPASMQEQVRMELERRDREQAAAAEKESEKNEIQSVKQMVAQLTETKPEPPQRRVERAFWGPR